MMFKNPIRVASKYGERYNFKEIITININQTKNYPVAINYQI